MSKSIINLFLVVVIVALYMFVIYPLQNGGGTLFGIDKSISELSTLNNDLTNNQLQAQDLTTKASKYQSDYQILTEDKFNRESVEQTLLGMIPKIVDPVRLEEEVVRILSNRGFAVDSISYSNNAQTATNGYGSYLVTFSTKGDYKRFKTLINDFEISKRIYVIKSVNFSTPISADGSINAGNYPFQVKLETYYMN